MVGRDLGCRVDVESPDIKFVRNFWTEWCMCRSVIVGKQTTVFLLEFLSFLSHCFLQTSFNGQMQFLIHRNKHI